jgi:predicted enzyme related to lactoylglutathione lyase
MAKVTGIGGVFFKASDPEALKQWYVKYLGVELTDWGGVVFNWADDQKAQADGGMTVWHLADADGDWFAPSTSQLMVNYRVDDLAGILARFAADGIEPVKGPDTEFNGQFAWVMDPEGNKVELWQPATPEETPPG